MAHGSGFLVWNLKLGYLWEKNKLRWNWNEINNFQCSGALHLGNRALVLGLSTLRGYAAGRGFEIGSLGLGFFEAEFQLLRRLVGQYGSK